MPTRTSLRRAAPFAAAVLASAGLAVTSAAATPTAITAASSSATVTIRDVAYHARKVTIRHGGSVTWRFVDPEVSHSVTSNGSRSRRFRSSRIKLTGTYKVKFRHAGTYTYHCRVHPGMHGKVVVR